MESLLSRSRDGGNLCCDFFFFKQKTAYEIYVVEDCCGDVNQLAHDNAMKRVIQAGAKPVTALSVMLEWQRDWAHKDTYEAVMDIVKTHFGAYGVGVEYAYTMVHGAPATKFPEYVVPSAAAHK